MSVRVVRLGSPRAPDEGTRLGTVRLSVHAVLSEDTVEMLRGAFVSFNTAATY